MKKIFSQFMLMMFGLALLIACKKDMDKHVVSIPTKGIEGFSSSVSTLVLSEETDAQKVVTFSFKAPDYGPNVIPSYTLEFDVPSDTSGAEAWANAIHVKLPSDSLQKSFSGADFNAMLSVQLAMPTDESNTLVVRLVSEVKQNTGVASTVKAIYSTLTMTVTPYLSLVEYPALLVKGGNSWKTPDARTNGYLLASAKFNSKYEGYLNLPNADGWGGDAFTLISTKDSKVYGWGTDGNTLSVGGGNLWLAPSPNYMKVNADVDALTITYTPVTFYIAGDDNAWSTSATPMVYDAATGVWTASNVRLTEGKGFAFAANDGWDISYKLDKAENGKLVFAGKDVWGGFNIPITKTGVYTVTLDMSGGEGNYTYSVR